MTKNSSGRFALFISDRSGLAFPYNEMVIEWNGARVHTSEFEKKQPQLAKLPALMCGPMFMKFFVVRMIYIC